MKLITDKYHIITRRKIFLTDIDNKNLTMLYLLSYYLSSSCEKYPNQYDFSKYKDKFYGLKTSVSVTIVGNKALLFYAISYADPKYIDDANYNNSLMDEVFNTITKAYLPNGKLDKDIFNKSKEVYRIDLEEVLSDEEEKANYNLIHKYFKKTNRDYMHYGSFNILKKLKINEVTEFYNNLLNTEHIDYIVGNVEEYNDSIDNFKIQNDYKFKIRNNKKLDLVIEKAKTKSGYLMLLIDHKVYAGEKLYYPLMLYNYFLGQSGYSLLFKNVREKDNLCYGIGASYYASTGITVISSQIDKINLNKTIDSIKDTIKNSLDNFNLEELKDKYYKQNKPNLDFIGSYIINHFYVNYFKDLSNENFKENVYNIKMDDIKKVKELYENIDFIYLYGGDLR